MRSARRCGNWSYSISASSVFSCTWLLRTHLSDTRVAAAAVTVKKCNYDTAISSAVCFCLSFFVLMTNKADTLLCGRPPGSRITHYTPSVRLSVTFQPLTQQVALLLQRGRAMFRVCLTDGQTSSAIFYYWLLWLQIYHCVRLNSVLFSSA